MSAPTPDETGEERARRIKAHAESIGRTQADTLIARRMVRDSAAGEVPRREMFIEAFAVGYQFGIIAGMEASSLEIQRLSARIAELEAGSSCLPPSLPAPLHSASYGAGYAAFIHGDCVPPDDVAEHPEWNEGFAAALARHDAGQS